MSTTAEGFGRDETIDVSLILKRLWRGRLLIIVSTVLCAAGATAAAFVMTPIYRASTVLIPATAEAGGMGGLGAALGQLGGLASLAGINLGGMGGTQIEETLAVLRSREFTEGFISDNELLTEIFYRRWDAVAQQWEGNEQDWPTLADAYREFDEEIRSVSHSVKTGLVTLQIEWRDADKAAAWANALVARLNAEMRAREIASTDASVGFLQKELDGTTVIETREAINRLMEAQINKRMYANVTDQYALRVVDRALVPDDEDIVRPKKPFMLVAGAGFGFLVGGVIVLLLGLRADRRATSGPAGT